MGMWEMHQSPARPELEKRELIFVIQGQLVIQSAARRCSQESEETLRGCLEDTDGNSLSEPYGCMITLMPWLSLWLPISCDCFIIPNKTVRRFPKDEPWITSDLKELLNKKIIAFKGDTWNYEELCRNNIRCGGKTWNVYFSIAVN